MFAILVFYTSKHVLLVLRIVCALQYVLILLLRIVCVLQHVLILLLHIVSVFKHVQGFSTDIKFIHVVLLFLSVVPQSYLKGITYLLF